MTDRHTEKSDEKIDENLDCDVAEPFVHTEWSHTETLHCALIWITLPLLPWALHFKSMRSPNELKLPAETNTATSGTKPCELCLGLMEEAVVLAQTNGENKEPELMAVSDHRMVHTNGKSWMGFI